jgi:hypothetical protein
MAGKNYIPTNDHEFLKWLEDVMAYASTHCARWYIANPESFLSEPWEDFKAKLTKASEPNSGKVDVFASKEARKKAEKEARDFVQGFLVKNKFVTPQDRVTMGLPIYDTTPTAVSDPTGQAEADIAYPGRTQLELRIKHISGTPTDSNANYGCRIYYGVYADGETPPANGKDLRESKFTRKKKELFTFDPADCKKTAFFCIRYENSKGAAGPWGPVFSATIP